MLWPSPWPSLGLARDHRALVLRSPTAEERAVAEAARWLRARTVMESGPIFSAHPLLALDLGLDPYDRTQFPPFRALDTAPAGALLLWDSHYAPVQAPHRPYRASGKPAPVMAARLPDSSWSFVEGFAAADTTWAGAFFVKGDSAGAPPDAHWFTRFRSASTGVAYARAAALADPQDPGRWRELAQRLAMAGRIEEARAAARTARRIREAAAAPGAGARGDSAVGSRPKASAP